MSINEYSLDISLFEKLELIGKGSFGEVFKIRKKETNEIYSAKISYTTMDGSTRQEFLNLSREVNINSKINHPSILKFIGYSNIDFNHESKPVIITEYLKNGCLSQIIDLERKSRALLDDTRKLLTIYGIAAGMSFLHEHDILHRDLKPANILIDDHLLPKIADFGFSKQIHAREETMTMQSTSEVKGTPAYISPEIYEDSNYTKAGDVYAFAFIVYEIWTNEEPFKNLTFFQIYNEVLKGHRPAFNFPIEPAYRDLIERCWSQDMDIRPKFESIVDELKNNPDFITGTIDEDLFREYIEYIDNCKSSFDNSKRVISVDDFIKKSKSNLFLKNDISKYIKSAGNFIYSQVYKWFPEQDNFLFSNDEFNELTDDCKQIVKNVKKDAQKQFDLGKSLIEGKNNFKQNIQVGMKYLEKSSLGGCIDSAVYLSQILTKSDLVPHDLEKSKKHLCKFLTKNDSRVLFLYAKILKKQNKPKEARKYFMKGVIEKHPESMYEYAKMLFLGEGGDQSEHDAKGQLYHSKNIFEKSDKYLRALNGMSKNKSFIKLQQKEKHFIIKQIIKYNDDDLSYTEIKMNSNQTEFLFESNSFSSFEFIDILQLFKSIFIEIKYPSKLYDQILTQVKNIKEDFIPNINICICISSLQNDEHKFGPDIFINSINLSSDVQIIPTNIFHKCKSIAHIFIPSSVIKIEEGAFDYCTSLSQISFDENSCISEIQRNVFSHCSSLEKINFPSSITKIGENSFNWCSSLEQIVIPESVSEIDSYAFHECSSLKRVVLPKSLSSISQGLFEECSSLFEVLIPSSVKKICCNAFKGCISLKHIFIPPSVTKIESSAFSNCSSLKDIVLPSCITYLGCSAFKNCKELQKVSIPESVTSIDEHTFDGCKSLESVSIPTTVASIGYYAFANCEALNEISIPNTVNSIGKGAFYCCSSLKMISIPSSMKEIRESVFEGCSSLTRISIPSSVISIGKNAFKDCSSLSEIPIPPSIDETQLVDIGFDLTFI